MQCSPTLICHIASNATVCFTRFTHSKKNRTKNILIPHPKKATTDIGLNISATICFMVINAFASFSQKR
jgi:hypothetical protein